MTPEEALALLDRLSHGQKLKDLQELVFRYSWEGWTYPQIAQHAGYDTSYIRDVGYQLWQQLSEALGEPVTKKNIQAVLRRQVQQTPNWQQQERDGRAEGDRPVSGAIRSNRLHSASQPQTSNLAGSRYQHWGEAIDVSVFYGRSEELTQLNQWILTDRCRIVALLGIGGVGKTALAAKLVEQLQDEFDYLIWQSLRNAPPIQEVLANLLQILSHRLTPESLISDAGTVDAQITQLMQHLQSASCLLVLDNMEAILSSSESTVQPSQTGQYREGYEGFDALIRRIGVERHLSCLVLTSREKPKTLPPLEGETLPVRTLPLSGLSSTEVEELFKANDCHAQSEADWQGVTDCYTGNPLALKIVSTMVRDLFDGNIREFLAQGAIAFGNINLLLEEQFQRLSELEKQVMYWLAMNREWMSLAELRDDFVSSSPQPRLLEVLLSIRQRSLLETQAGQFTLQPVVMEYVTEQLIEHISKEIESQQLNLFMTHALMKAQAKDYIRDSQIRVILAPLVARLISRFRTKKELEYQLNTLLLQLQAESPMLRGYSGGNLINLLHHLGVDLSGYDFSRLNIWQANLQNVNLQNVNFANADLAKSRFTQPFSSVLSVAFSPNNTLLAMGDSNGGVYIWRVDDAEVTFLSQGHSDWVTSVAFSPDGQLLASASDDCYIKLWDIQTGQLSQTLSGHQQSVRAIAFSPEGRSLVSSSHDGTAKLWDVETGRVVQTFVGHGRSVRSVDFSPTGQWVATSGDDCTIKLWAIATGEQVRSFEGHEQSVRSVVFSRDGQTLISGSNDRTVRLWDVQTGECLKSLAGHSNIVLSVALHPQGHLLASGSEDQTIKLWDVQTGECLGTWQAHRDWVWAVAFSPDGQLLTSGSDDQSLKLWDVQTGQCLQTLSGYTNQVFAVGLYPNGQRLASGSLDGMVRIWDSRNSNLIQSVQAHRSWVRAIEFSPDGQLLASGSTDQTIKVWQVATLDKPREWIQPIKTLSGHSGSVRSVAWSSDQRLASGSADRTIRLWDGLTGTCTQILQGHTGWIREVAWSPDSQILASASDDQTVRLWNPETGENIAVLRGHEKWLSTVAWSFDGELLASGGADHTIRLWSAKTGECLTLLQAHRSQIQSVAFNPTRPMLASGGGDHTIKLWGIKTSEVLCTLQGHVNQVQCVKFAPDGQTLVSASDDGTLRIWQVETGRCLQTLVGDRPYEGMNITGVTGLTQAQHAMLKVLGAIEQR